MRNRWQADFIAQDAVEALIYQARCVGEEPALVLWGGGNNSMKTIEVDFDGSMVQAMRIKGSGGNMLAMQRRDYPAVRLAPLLALFEREAMSDEEMVRYVRHTLLDPDAPRPSIETLLHAFIPAPAVLHTHADAILMLTNTRGREATVRACFGDDVLIVPYLRPGFQLSKLVGAAVRANPNARGLVLMNHGLVTWGETPKEAYDRHIALVTEAEAFVAQRVFPAAAPAVPTSDVERRRALAVRIAPILRGLLSRERRVVLRFDDSDDVMTFMMRPDAPQLLQAGAATPDHMLHTKRAALWAPLPLQEPLDDATIREHLRAHLEAYEAACKRRFAQHYDPSLLSAEAAAQVSDLPRVIFVPGVGMWTAGRDMRAATVAADIAHHTLAIMQAAQALGGYVSLNDAEAFHAEYWPLELYKLTLAPPERELARRVALVTGAGHGIGKAIALRLAAEGAHVVVTDIDEAAARAVAEQIVQQHGLGRALALHLDVTDEASVNAAFDRAVLTYGGVDIVISNAGIARAAAIVDLSLEDWQRSLAVNATGHFLVSRAALRLMQRQGIGGSLVFNATKNVTAPGKEFGAYSAAKAAEAQLCRIVAIEGGEHGIRANMVNPDAVFSTQLWSPELRRQRAQAQGIPENQIEEYYAKRNLLRARVTAEDVAEAVFWLASDRSAKTTGAMIPVDGGVREAFPR